MLCAIESARTKGGYAWWYIEAHDTVEQRYGLTLIVFAGSVFSPHYAARLRAGQAAMGLEHPAINLALYERADGQPFPSRRRIWVMNEYPPATLHMKAQRLALPQSSVDFCDDGSMRVEVHEQSTRFFGRPGPKLDAVLRISAPPLEQSPIELGRNSAGEVHYWQPLATAAAASVELDCGPLSVRYRGIAYCDHNFGNGRLENTFSHWSWAHGVSQAKGDSRASLILYRAQLLSGAVTGLYVRCEHAAHAPSIAPIVQRYDAEATRPPKFGRRDFFWLPVPAEVYIGPAVSQRLSGGQLEDTPFYARHMARLDDASGSYFGVGEYLDLNRFRLRAVQRLLTYKTRQVSQ